jgi:hypothetical protein
VSSIVVPFAALPPLCAPLREALTAAALRMNDRYLEEFIEGQAFCPFARGGREAGETQRFVHHAESLSIEPLLELMQVVARDTKKVVSQVIFPRVEVEPAAWIRFVDELTAEGHARMGGGSVLAFAALHPRLPYKTDNSLALIPLFRRTPDPTIQWVRLDALKSIYEGRGNDVKFVDPADIPRFLREAPPPKEPLYDRIADVNARNAEKIGLRALEAQIAAVADDARAEYARILAAHDCATHG